MRIRNAADGRPIETRRAGAGERRDTARSENGRLLAITTDTETELHDLIAGKRVEALLPKGQVVVGRFAVSNDGRWLLFTDQISVAVEPRPFASVTTELVKRLMLRDTSTGKDRCLSENEQGLLSLGFSADGKRIVTSGQQGTRVWDVANGKRLWEKRNFYAEECRFTADGTHIIAAPGGGLSDWHVWDANTGKDVAGLHPPTVGYAWSFAVSPDGNLLLIPTYDDYVVWNLKAGVIRHRWPGARSWGRGVFAPDGKSVITYDTILRRWDLVTGKNIYANVTELGHVDALERLFFTPDGTRLVSMGKDYATRIWDLTTAKPIRSIPQTGDARMSWTISPDGATLIGVDRKLTVKQWPLVTNGPKTSSQLRPNQKIETELRPRDVHTFPDGTLALLAWPDSPEFRFHRFSFSFWDLSTGQLVRWGGDPGNDYRGEYTRMSPDGRYAASPDATYDTRTGVKHILPSNPFGQGGVPLFSPDSRFVAAAARGTRVWELATGRAVAEVPGDSLDHAAFSPDGRRLAVALWDRFSVWEPGARKTIFEGSTGDRSLTPRQQVEAIAFSPDGRTLATGHADGTILLWPIPRPVPDGRWSEVDANGAWDLLIDENSANAYPAVWQLMDYPVEAVQFLRGKFNRVALADADEWDRLIAALDSPRFAAREAASKRVRELGRSAEKPLRDALKRAPSPEQFARIEALLAGLDMTARPRGEDLRAIRAVAVLEGIAMPEARQLLTDWAERGSPPRLADEAQRAADRLKYRK
ncbi:MAG TPA: hypothetical protein VHR66_23245 [Gemmataceae bacterium]|nr:hypothetical protein [Gemmataceae bacterium]